MVIKIKDTLYLVNVNLYCLSSYKKTYSNEQSLNFVIPIIVILFLGIIYTMTQRADSGYVSFILIGGAAITMIYWIKVIKKMANDQKPVTYNQSKEQETKNWVYDLIKGEGEFVFVAEVPGPEDKISVRRTIFLLVFGISTPMTDFPSITSTTLTLITDKDLAISCAIFVISLALVPGAG